MEVLISFIIYVCSHTQCVESAKDYDPIALVYWITEFRDFSAYRPSQIDKAP